MPRPAGLLEPAAPRSLLGRAEEARLRAVARYVILDTPPEPAFDDITELATHVSGWKFAAITLVDTNRVWVKSARGFSAAELPRHASFCSPLFELGAQLIGDSCTDARCGTVRWVQHAPYARCYAAEPLITSDGFTLGHLLVMDDSPRALSTRQRAGLAALGRQVMALLELRRTLICYHTVIDGAGLVVFHVDASGRLVSVTPTWAKLTGHGVVRSVGKPLDTLMHPEDGPLVRAELRRVLEEQSATRLDCRVATASGGDLPAELFAQPLPTGRGFPPGVVGVITDISERRAREIEDQHRQKLESLGRVAAGVAHEINTPIQFVGDNTRFLTDVYAKMLQTIETYQAIVDNDWSAADKLAALTNVGADIDWADISVEVPSAVTQTLDGIDRVATIVRAMKAMSHPGRDHPAPADVNEAVQATVAIARNEVKYDADVVLNLGTLPPVTCFIADLSQVFLNLLINAGDAIRDSGRRGRITVTTRHDGADLIIQVADTGVGVRPETAARMFEPFFTTKPMGRGTGQGLALAHVVIYERHNGTIEVDSTPGVGTTFTLRIPIASPHGGHQ